MFTQSGHSCRSCTNIFQRVWFTHEVSSFHFKFTTRKLFSHLHFAKTTIHSLHNTTQCTSQLSTTMSGYQITEWKFNCISDVSNATALFTVCWIRKKMSFAKLKSDKTICRHQRVSSVIWCVFVQIPYYFDQQSHCIVCENVAEESDIKTSLIIWQ